MVVFPRPAIPFEPEDTSFVSIFAPNPSSDLLQYVTACAFETRFYLPGSVDGIEAGVLGARELAHEPDVSFVLRNISTLVTVTNEKAGDTYQLAFLNVEKRQPLINCAYSLQFFNDRVSC